jgi:hypothetical protein
LLYVVNVQVDYGIDWNGPVPKEIEENEENHVSVPSINCSLNVADWPNDHTSSLQDGSYRVKKYLQVRMFVQNH